MALGISARSAIALGFVSVWNTRPAVAYPILTLTWRGLLHEKGICKDA